MKLILSVALVATVFVPPKERHYRAIPEFARTPLIFESNEGQSDRDVKFVARGARYVAFLGGDTVVLRSANQRSTEAPVRMRFAGSATTARLSGTRPLASVSHYFIGNDSARWRTGVPNFSRVECRGLYRDIDLVYQSQDGELELDWMLAPGADAKQIRLEFDGVDRVEIGHAGELRLERQGSALQFRAPTLYQQRGTERRRVAGGYRIVGTRAVSFDVGEYDTTQMLVIDPVISFSSYLGGHEADFGLAVATDRDGAVYVAGQSLSTQSPTAGTLVAYVAKLDPSGSAAEWVAFVGGTEPPVPENLLFDRMSLAVDGAGFTYLTGDTMASDFPAVHAVQPRPGGMHDAFVVKLGPAGSPIVYSTYLGGSADDWGRSLALDADGNLLLTGITGSPDFPTAHALQPHLNGTHDAFVAKLDPSGSTLLYSTFLGGSDGLGPQAAGDLGYAVAADREGNAYVCGYTSSRDFPTVNALRDFFSGGSHDAFISKIAVDGSRLLYSTYLGGASDEECLGIAVDRSGSAYVTGWTSSADFPAVGTATRFGGALDAFAAKLTADGQGLVYSRFIGGTLADFAYDLVIDDRGDAYIVGATSSPDFPVVAAAQPLYGGGASDAFVSVVSADGASLLSSTFLGGSGAENLLVTSMGIALSRSAVLVAGTTNSTNFPLVRPVQTAIGGPVDAFVAAITRGPAVALDLQGSQSARLLTVDISNGDTVPRDVELKLWVASAEGTFLLYATGLPVTLAPSETRRLPALTLPAAFTRGDFEVQANLVDGATGEVVSATCTGNHGRCSGRAPDLSPDR